MQNNINTHIRHYIYKLNKNDSIGKVCCILTIFNAQLYHLTSELPRIINKDFLNDISSLDEEGAEKLIKIFNNKQGSTTFNDINIFLNVIDEIFNTIDSITVVIETNYIDRVYRDSYYMHFSERHIECSRYCKRLVFFANDQLSILDSDSYSIVKRNYKTLQKNLIGTMVIRPIAGQSIGRTCIDPKYMTKESLIRVGKTKFYCYGLEFTINAFPYSMQDGVTTSCAEITLINTLDYYSNMYSDYRYLLPSHINNIIQRIHFDRHIPAVGLSYQNISRVFQNEGFSPKLYMISESQLDSSDSIRRFLSYYIESGIPVAVGLSKSIKQTIGHSVVFIGHKNDQIANISKYAKELTIKNKDTLSKNDTTEESKIWCTNAAYLHDSFIVQDDKKTPYTNLVLKDNECNKGIIFNSNAFSPDADNTNLKCMIAPLYKRMYMDAFKAETLINDFIAFENFSPKYEQLKIGESKDNPLIYKLFLASSRHYKEFIIEKCNDEIVQTLYREIPLPQFIWVCELYRTEGLKQNNKKAFGQIILDATYCGKDLYESCLMVNYPDRHLAKNQNGESFFINDENETDDSTTFYNPYDWFKVERTAVDIYPAYTLNLNN